MTKKLVVINHDVVFLEMLKVLLSDEGYEVILGGESAMAHALVREHHPDLVLLDIRLDQPEAGWKVLDLLRLDPKTVTVPVIVASTDPYLLRDKAGLLRARDCDILEKPFTFADLLTKIRQCLDMTHPN